MKFLYKLLNAVGIKGKQVNVLVVGLDNSGKSTTLEKFKAKNQQSRTIVPTVGFTVDEFDKDGLNFTAFDMSGAGRYRNLWEKYYRDADAIIFVIDSADKLRMVVAKDELDSLLAHTELRTGIPVLVLANKNDLPTALNAVEIAQAASLENIRNHPWQIFSSNALTGQGLEQAIDWLAEQLKKQVNIQKRV